MEQNLSEKRPEIDLSERNWGCVGSGFAKAWRNTQEIRRRWIPLSVLSDHVHVLNYLKYF